MSVKNFLMSTGLPNGSRARTMKTQASLLPGTSAYAWLYYRELCLIASGDKL